jgi:hypothetical protein
MKLKLLIAVFLSSLLIHSCQMGPEKGSTTKILPENLKDYFSLNSCSLDRQNISLKKNGAGVTSKFAVRNFEFSAKIKSSAGSEGLISSIPGTSSVPIVFPTLYTPARTAVSLSLPVLNSEPL